MAITWSRIWAWLKEHKNITSIILTIIVIGGMILIWQGVRNPFLHIKFTCTELELDRYEALSLHRSHESPSSEKLSIANTFLSIVRTIRIGSKEIPKSGHLGFCNQFILKSSDGKQSDCKRIRVLVSRVAEGETELSLIPRPGKDSESSHCALTGQAGFESKDVFRFSLENDQRIIMTASMGSRRRLAVLSRLRAESVFAVVNFEKVSLSIDESTCPAGDDFQLCSSQTVVSSVFIENDNASVDAGPKLLVQAGSKSVKKAEIDGYSCLKQHRLNLIWQGLLGVMSIIGTIAAIRSML